MRTTRSALSVQLITTPRAKSLRDESPRLIGRCKFDPGQQANPADCHHLASFESRQPRSQPLARILRPFP